jgi:gliding motility-associated-like protein
VAVAAGAALTGTVSSTATSCSGAADATITATPGNGNGPYQYSLDGGSFQASNMFSNVGSGNHAVTMKDVAGCTSAPIQVTVAVGAALTATAATTPTSCSGAINGTITITPTSGTGPFQYSLDGVNFQSSNSFTGLATGSYTVTVKNNSGCVSTVAATVNPGQPLSATAAVSNVLCNGGNTGSVTISISTNGAPPYQYSLDGNTWQSANTFTGLAAGSYSVQFKDNNNCSGTQAFTISQPAPLAITPAEQAALCNGQSNGHILVAATGGTAPYQYSIDGINYQSSNSFNAGAGSYTVYVKDNNNCIKSQSVVVTEPQILTATAAVTNSTCAGNDGTITVSSNGGAGNYQYSLNGTTFQGSNVFHVGPGNYTIIIKDANGCTTTRNASVGLVNNLVVTPVADTVTCEGVSVKLEPNTNATQFTWTPATGLSATNTAQPFATPSVTTQYIVTASLGICSANDSIVVNVLPAPVPDAGADGDICYGQSYQLQGSGGVTYQWSPDTYLNTSFGSSPVVTPTQTIQYALSVTGANGCRSLQPDVVTINVTPPIVVQISRDTVVAYGDVFQLHASSVATDYLWSPGFGLDDVTKANPIVTVTGDITYTVTATTSAGCIGDASVTLKVYKGPEIYVPTAFTPNGDGKNDVFKPFPVGIKSYTYFRVYNRWGQLIFSTADFNRGWDGTIGGKQQPTGTYVWVVEGITKDDKIISKRGSVTLIR